MNVKVNLMEENVIQINGGIMINVDVSVKKFMYVKKIMFGIPVNVFLKYLASIMHDSTIISNEVIKSYEEEIKTVPRNLTCQRQNFYMLLAFSLVTIALLITVSIYCYLIKYRVKKFLPFHDINNKLNKFCIDSIN